jgi:hypothetical protein
VSSLAVLAAALSALPSIAVLYLSLPDRAEITPTATETLNVGQFRRGGLGQS